MPNKQGGFIRGIILIIILIGVLSYFHVSIRTIVESDAFKENFGYVWNWVVFVWNTYLASPANYLWNIFINYFWNMFLESWDAVRRDTKIPALDKGGWYGQWDNMNNAMGGAKN